MGEPKSRTAWRSILWDRGTAILRTLSGIDGAQNPPARQTKSSTEVTIKDHARVQLKEFFEASEPRRTRYSHLPTLFEGASSSLRLHSGFDLNKSGYSTIGQVFDLADATTCLQLIRGVQLYLNAVERRGQSALLPILPAQFERAINGFFEQEGIPLRLAAEGFARTVFSDLEALRRALLLGGDEMASCQQGDLQVEMVASTVQASLVSPGAVLVDYGCGLGRVLAGLSSAPLFQQALYVAVDEPIGEKVRMLAERVGGTASFMGRDEFIRSSIMANVVMVVNTLHHMPFSDMARQLAALVAHLKMPGHLLIHDMGQFSVPEQRNVPWPGEYIEMLFDDPCFKTNLRTTVSRGKRIPIANVLISVTQRANFEEVLHANVQRVWAEMKKHTVSEISALYESSDPNLQVELHHALFRNANLDINRP
ncbi:hypothetical protein ACNOYE_34700 [Nannocystaceae bacterium ST9]